MASTTARTRRHNHPKAETNQRNCGTPTKTNPGAACMQAPPGFAYCPSWARTTTLLIQNVTEQKKCVTGEAAPARKSCEDCCPSNTAGGQRSDETMAYAPLSPWDGLRPLASSMSTVPDTAALTLSTNARSAGTAHAHPVSSRLRRPESAPQVCPGAPRSGRPAAPRSATRR